MSLYVLILISSGLTVALSANAAARSRRREFGTLAGFGWTSRQVRTEMLVEQVTLGVGAGLVGAVAAWPLSTMLRVGFDARQAWTAIPTAVLLTLAAGIAAVHAAERTEPLDALRPEFGGGARGHPVSSAPGLGVCLGVARRGRFLLGAAAVAIATGTTTGIGTVIISFQGAIVSSLLGEAVAIQAKATDFIAGGFLVILGLVAVRTVLKLNLVEDSPIFAMLLAAGWKDRTLLIALLSQVGVLASAGGVIGAAGALGVVALVGGKLYLSSIAIAATGVILAVTFSALLAWAAWILVRRTSPANVLARK